MNTKKKTLLSIASKFAIPVLILLVFVATGTIFAIRAFEPIYKASGWPGFFETLFNYSRYIEGHPARLAGQIISNAVAYLFMAGAVILCILSFALIKHDKALRLKSAVIALLLLVPSTFGLVGGFVNFCGEGINTLLNTGSNGALISFLLVVTFVLDFLYYILAVVYLVNAVKTAVKVNRGELVIEDEQEEQPQGQEEDDAERKLKKQEERAERRAQLLKDIRIIVREELERHGVVTVKEVAKQVDEDEEEEPKQATKNQIVRIPFAQKIVKADKDLQEKYNQLKNEIMAYGASARLSVSGDTFRLHRKPYVKITLVGKALKVYFALDPKDFVDSTMPIIDASDKNAYAEVPSLLKVKSNLSMKRAMELIALAFNRDGIVKKENVEEVNYIKEIRAELRNQK